MTWRNRDIFLNAHSCCGRSGILTVTQAVLSPCVVSLFFLNFLEAGSLKPECDAGPCSTFDHARPLAYNIQVHGR